MTVVIMPDLGATESVSTLLRWLVSEGDQVRQGQPIFEAESDKATVEIEAAVDGTLGRILVLPGTVVPAGEVVALIQQPGERLNSPPPGNATVKDGVAGRQAVSSSPPSVGRSTTRVVATPLARSIAAREHVNLGELRGTGPGGRVIRADVLDALQSRSPKGKDVAGASQPLVGLRGAIARRMAEGAQTTAPVTLTCQVEASALVQVLKGLRSRVGEGASYDLLLAMIAGQCLIEHSALNVSLGPEGIVRHQDVHIGVAVDTDRGLVVPVLRDVPNRSLLELAGDLQGLVRRAKKGELSRDEMRGGTFTITNLGMYRVDFFTPIINLPECAVLGVGRIHDAPVIHDGVQEVGTVLGLSLTFDHRLVDGAPAARFLSAVADYVEQPGLLLVR